jgi:hypothetical protein
MKYGKITLSTEDGEVYSEGVVRYWNAGRDPTGPCVCVTIEGKDLDKFLKVKIPKDSLLQIELPFPDIAEVAVG